MTTQFEDPKYLDAVYSALLKRLKSATFPPPHALVTAKRAWVPPTDVAAASQPALFLFEGPMKAVQSQAQGAMGLTKWQMSAMAAVYLRVDVTDAVASEPDPLPTTIVDYFIWGIVRSLGTTPSYQKQTLDGLVYHCWVEGEIDPAISQDGQVVITIPIMILPGTVG